MQQAFLTYLHAVIDGRLRTELLQETSTNSKNLSFEAQNSPLSNFIISEKLYHEEVVLLLLALVPHVSPGFLFNTLSSFLPNGGDLPEFGAVKGNNHRGMLPTAETALFVLSGNDFAERQKVQQLFTESVLFKKGVLSIDGVPHGEPKMSGRLLIDAEYAELFGFGRVSKPKLSLDFPAQCIETGLSWDDLVLQPSTLLQIKDIEIWLNHHKTLMEDWQMQHRIKPGFRVLFYGAPGTGKTLTASLLGKYTNRDVYRVDLSTVVSKYIGETEKNLSNLFNKAANKDWILFFDEADALFGKRTNVRDAHDKYANQEVSYLLQRIEMHPGLIILASNFKGNIDSAFTRRFNSIIEFEMPGAGERLKIWQKNLPKQLLLDKPLNLEEISKKYSLSGANIINVIQNTSLHCLSTGETTITKESLINGIKKEFLKEGKIFNE